MKKLLLILLLCTSSLVHADILAWLKNRAGGYIYFTDTQCSGKGEYWKIVYGTTQSGGSTFGCWFYADGMVHVQWNSGNTSAFNASDLTFNSNKGSY